MLPLVAFLTVLSQQELSAEAIYERTTPSVLTLSVQRRDGVEGIGTAFLAIRPGLAVTAWHVVKDAEKIIAKFSDGKEATVTGIVDNDPTLDLAIVSIDSAERPVLKFSEGDPKVGSKAFVIGTPRGLEFSISDGIISQTPLFGDSKLYQFTCPVSQGNSGGPLLNASGQVLGVVSWQLRDAQNLNFAVPGSFAAKLNAEKAPQPIPVAPAPTGSWPSMFTSVSDDMLTEVLKGTRLKAEPVDDGTGMTSYVIDCDGTKVSLFQYSRDQKPGPAINLSMSTGFEGAGKPDFQKLNEFNQAHRFARCYVDDSGVVYVENDLDAEKGIGIRTLRRFVDRYNASLKQFMAEVFGKGATSLAQTQFVLKEDEFNEQELEAILEGCGYQVRKGDDGTGKSRFTFTLNGLDITLYQFTDRADAEPTTSLTLMLGLDLADSASLRTANRFNAQSEYTKAFIDSDGDPYLVSDLDLVGGVSKESVTAFIDRFVKAAPGFTKLFSSPASR